VSRYANNDFKAYRLARKNLQANRSYLFWESHGILKYWLKKIRR